MRWTVCILMAISLSGSLMAIGFNPSDTQSLFTDSLRHSRMLGFQHISQINRSVKRMVAASLAFPFPFGITGIHRVYLGTSPYVPVVYMATLGGGLGILPSIDFILLLTDKNLEAYRNRNRVFMWQP